MSESQNKTLKCPREPFPKTTFVSVMLTCFVVLMVVIHNQDQIKQTLMASTFNFDDFFVKPNFSKKVILEIIVYFVETLEVAFLGTLLGAVISLPLALLASDMGGAPWLTSIVRSVLAFIRSIPMIFYAYIIVKFTGLGLISGVIAIMIYATGILSKQFIDEIANLDDTVAHSIMSTGAGRFQVFWFGLLPELLPNFIAFSLLRFEINIREASILGVVGAGGVGVLLKQYGWIKPYDKLWTLIIFFFIVVVLIEILCRWTIKVVK